jgi:hypothetical protein
MSDKLCLCFNGQGDGQPLWQLLRLIGKTECRQCANLHQRRRQQRFARCWIFINARAANKIDVVDPDEMQHRHKVRVEKVQLVFRATR